VSDLFAIEAFLSKHYVRNTWVVVPSYNEGRVIASAVSPLVARGFSVVVVDDGSADDTGAQARSAGASVLRHILNLGQGAALQTGIDFALSKGARFVCTYDGDGQHHPQDLETLLDALAAAGADAALGSRFLGGAAGMPPIRRLVLKGAIVFTRLHTGLSLTDTHNGVRAFTREGISRFRILQPRMAHASEIIEHIARLKLKFVEVPVTISYSEYSLKKGQSAFGSFRVLLDLWTERMLR
jgi:glycosyltransferase involved in cell wall biosynthesis